jgi:acyl carrier protein phosphodiesterase
VNYIAHMHIGAHTHLLGNFLGDFIKGSQLQYLPFEIEQGVRLHRSMDVFTSLVVKFKQCFPSDIRRMAELVIDIYFDYLLMQTWHRYSKTHSKIVFADFYQQRQFSLPENTHFNQQAERLKNRILFAQKAQFFYFSIAISLSLAFKGSILNA